MKELLDTHIWIWAVTGDARLPRSLGRRIERDPSRFAVSPISQWEVIQLVRRDRLRIDTDVAGWLERSRGPFSDVPITSAVVDALARMSLDGFDPGDAFLVATSKAFGLTLVTLDERLLELDSIEVTSR